MSEGLGKRSSIPNLPAVIVVLSLSVEHLFERRICRKALLQVAGAILPSRKRGVASHGAGQKSRTLSR